MEVGRLLGNRYRLERVLGAGGMGVVYLARDLHDGRAVAVKVLHEDPDDDPQRRKRFLREAWAVSQLSHPYIVKVYEQGDESDGASWIAMEYLDGTNLGDILERGRLPLRDVVATLVPVARALGAAHRAGFVHRDVKPDNIIVCGDGRPVLVDFGITRTISHRAPNRGTVDQLTRTGVLVGTPEYMSPEQVRGIVLDGRSDQFSLAVVCYEALTGVRPFNGDAAMAVIAAVLTDPVVPVIDLAPEVPREVSNGIAKALSKKPDERFASIDAFADLLDGYVPTSVRGIDVRSFAGRAEVTSVGSNTVVDMPTESLREDHTTEPRGDRASLVPSLRTDETARASRSVRSPTIDRSLTTASPSPSPARWSRWATRPRWSISRCSSRPRRTTTRLSARPSPITSRSPTTTRFARWPRRGRRERRGPSQPRELHTLRPTSLPSASTRTSSVTRAARCTRRFSSLRCRARRGAGSPWPRRR